MTEDRAADSVVGRESDRATPPALIDAGRILEMSQDAFVATDSHGVVIAWNPAAEAIFGYARSEAMGREMDALIIPADGRAAHHERLADFDPARAASDGARTGEFVALHRSGREFPVEVTHWWIDTPEGTVFYAFLRDVSERKHRELELGERRMREAELTRRALHDNLTGLANRVLALEWLTAALARRARYGGKVALLFVDLDRFKLVNDSLGHDAGDELLRVVAHRLTGAVREVDSVARIAGDEFVVVCDQIRDADEALAIAERILQSLQEPIDLIGESVRIWGSIGIVIAQGGTETAEDLLRDADAAMYRAKELGRAQVVVFDESMRQRLRNELHMEREIAECLDRGELDMWYRPMVDLRQGRVCGMQPMMSWRNPRLGVLSPPSFTAVAAEIGVLPAILDWALHDMCAQAKTWRDGGNPELILAPDFSARQIAYPSFFPSLTSALGANGLPGSALVIGVLPPPGILPFEEKALLATLDSMRSLGVAVGINGSGVESAVLTWLAEVPFDAFTIAPQFGSAVGVRPRIDLLVSSLVAMGRGMGMTVTVNGIETAAQRATVTEFGCDFAMGPLFGEMAPPPGAIPQL